MNSRWPDYLARRLAARKGPRVGVLNAGISGNQVLGDGAGVSALARFDRDVLMQTGVTHVIVMEGINDIGLARSEPEPECGGSDRRTQATDRAGTARGLKVYGATLTPFEGAAYWTAEGEAKRQALNEWIRTSKAYDPSSTSIRSRAILRPRQSSCRRTTPAITCTRVMPVTRRWAKRWI